MSIFKRKSAESDCPHRWRITDFETAAYNAGSSVDFDDYVILRCTICGHKRRVDEYELYRLQRYGLVDGGDVG